MWNLPSLNSATRVKKKNRVEESEVLYLPETDPELTEEKPSEKLEKNSPSDDVPAQGPSPGKVTAESPSLSPAAAGAEEPMKAEIPGSGPVKPVPADEEPKKDKLFQSTSGRKASTPSIKDALSSLNAPKTEEKSKLQEEEDVDTEDTEEESFESESIDADELMKIWEKYVESLKADSPRMYLALSSMKPVVEDDDKTIAIALRNNALLAEFKQHFKISLLAHLRQKLNHNMLEIKEIVLDPDQNSESRHYTEVDKLKFMIEKNPSLKKLRQDFNLDFE